MRIGLRLIQTFLKPSKNELRKRTGGEYPRSSRYPVGQEGVDVVHRKDQDASSTT